MKQKGRADQSALSTFERLCGSPGGYVEWWFLPRSGQRPGSDLDRIRNELASSFHPSEVARAAWPAQTLRGPTQMQQRST
jgi:hypothetical protein